MIRDLLRRFGDKGTHFGFDVGRLGADAFLDSRDRVFTNIDSVANTSGASIPIAIDEAVRSGRLRNGMNVCLVGFGAGLTYGGMLTRWPNL